MKIMSKDDWRFCVRVLVLLRSATRDERRKEVCTGLISKEFEETRDSDMIALAQLLESARDMGLKSWDYERVAHLELEIRLEHGMTLGGAGLCRYGTTGILIEHVPIASPAVVNSIRNTACNIYEDKDTYTEHAGPMERTVHIHVKGYPANWDAAKRAELLAYAQAISTGYDIGRKAEH